MKKGFYEILEEAMSNGNDVGFSNEEGKCVFKVVIFDKEKYQMVEIDEEDLKRLKWEYKVYKAFWRK